ncbi:MAG TPA: SprT family zinc-dependent metalloprotease [Candidatus Saccharimonadales bacterium]|nr:SprT family zinc-dependent metalloprotease [Candidatus Saccharimonadales bacterium]
MAKKEFLIDDVSIIIYKRKQSRSLKLSVSSQGKVQISIPTWAPYSAGIEFAHHKRAWIQDQLPSGNAALYEGQAIGKSHHLNFVPVRNAVKPASRIRNNLVLVYYPQQMKISENVVQAEATKASLRALRNQALQLLPLRLEQLAEQYSFTYHSVQIKKLKSRWGSCDQEQNIVLNLYLMQLPWDCIDYVLLHELTHTRVMQHGPRFWEAMSTVLPQAKELRNKIRAYQPILERRNESKSVSV